MNSIFVLVVRLTNGYFFALNLRNYGSFSIYTIQNERKKGTNRLKFADFFLKIYLPHRRISLYNIIKIKQKDKGGFGSGKSKA